MHTLTISNSFVVLMGLGVVFFGLICIILLCKVMGLFCKLLTRKSISKPTLQSENTASNSGTETIANRQEILAAISAVLAEELGTDVNAIRIHSFRKL